MSFTPSTVAQAVATAAGSNMAGLAAGAQTALQTSIAGGNLAPAASWDALRTGLTTALIGVGAFQNSWTNAAGGTLGAGYYKDASGRVYLQGCIKTTGALNTIAFTLPTGFHPGGIVSFACISNSSGTTVLGQVSVDSSGNVTPVAGNIAQMFLDGISFVAV